MDFVGVIYQVLEIMNVLDIKKVYQLNKRCH